MGAQGYVIATALEAVLAQRLVRRLCSHCAVDHVADEHEAAWLARHAQGAEADFRQGAGCERCGNTGYQGRIGVYELLQMRGDLLVALRNQDIDGFAAAAQADPTFRPIVESALDLARDGRTSLAEVIRVSGEGEG
jgi:MSHA biogenesis protein MshE